MGLSISSRPVRITSPAVAALGPLMSARAPMGASAGLTPHCP